MVRQGVQIDAEGVAASWMLPEATAVVGAVVSDRSLVLGRASQSALKRLIWGVRKPNDIDRETWMCNLEAEPVWRCLIPEAHHR